MGRRLALLIATYEYQDPGLGRLTAPAHDAGSLAAVLRDPDIAGFEVTTLVNEPHHRVGEAIGDLYRDRRRDDLTLLYFTGHGLKDDAGRLYLAMTNTRRAGLLFTSLPAEQINQAMTDCMSRQKVLILDCCYGGAFPAGGITKADTAVHTLERFQGRGRSVLTASDAMQYSFEGDHRSGSAAQSVFTRHLVAGLRDGSADLDGDGDITIDELYRYVHDRVVEEMPRQRPKKQEDVEGRIIIARNVNWSLPPYLSNALASPIATDRLAAVDALEHLRRIGNDLVRQHVTTEIERLTDDDSKLVSAAAMRVRSSLAPTPEPDDQDSASPPADAPEPPAPETPTPPPGPAGSTVTWRPRRSRVWLFWFVLGVWTFVLTLGETIYMLLGGRADVPPIEPGLFTLVCFLIALRFFGRPVNAKEAHVEVHDAGITVALDGRVKKCGWDDIERVSIRPFNLFRLRRASSPTSWGLWVQARGTRRYSITFGWPPWQNGRWTLLLPLGRSDDPHIQKITDALSHYGRDRWTPNG